MLELLTEISIEKDFTNVMLLITLI